MVKVKCLDSKVRVSSAVKKYLPCSPDRELKNNGKFPFKLLANSVI